MISSLVNRISPRLFAVMIALVSVASLGAALTAQYGFGMRPCELCLIQRVPFALNMLLGLAGAIWLARSRLMISLASLTFLVNSGVAFYHSGVERHWWNGLTGCTTPDMSGSIEDLMARIQQTDVVRCDEIPWDFLGLSMANYNVIYCFGLGLVCIFYLFLTRSNRP